MRSCFHTATVLVTLASLMLALPVRAARPGDRTLDLEPDPRQRTMIAFYTDLQQEGKPMLITVDSALWAVHLLREQTRAQLETAILTPRLQTVLGALEKSLNASGEETPSWIQLDSGRVNLPPALTEPARRARLYVQTAQLLLAGETNPPAPLQAEWNRIQTHETWAFSDVFDQKLDYAALEPRGQSLRTETLRCYYRSSRYLGNLLLRLDQKSARKTGQPFDHPQLEGGWFQGVHTSWTDDRKREEMARLEAQYPSQGLMEMRAAALLSLILENTHLSPEQTALDVWKEMDAAETQWSGESQDLDPPALLASLKTCAPKPETLERTLAFLADDYDTLTWLAWLEARLQPLAYCQTPDSGRRGFSLYGRRYSPDSRILCAMRSNDTWPGRANASQKRIFTSVPDTNGETLRGGNRGLDLLAALGNPQASLLLKRDGDFQYFGMDNQKKQAQEVWKGYLPEEKGFFRKLGDPFSFAKKANDPAEGTGSIEQSLIQAVEQTAGALSLRRLPDYARQTDHEFLRANSALAFWVSLQRESEQVEIASPQEEPVPNKTAPDPSPTTGPVGLCYVDPYPTLYHQLARTAGNMAAVLEKSNRLSTPFIQNARPVEQLLKTLERVALQQAGKSDRISPEDRKTLCEWGPSLARALELPSEEAIRIGFRLDEPVPTIVTLQNRGGATFQAGIGPLWTVTTSAPILGQNIQVTGAIFPYFEAKRPEEKAWTAAQWQDLHRKQEPLAPTLLRECSTFQKLLPRFPRYFEASYQSELNLPVQGTSTPFPTDGKGTETVPTLPVLPVTPVFAPAQNDTTEY
jgi:hypothetical protein